jgi:hypothetical protein
VPAGEARVALPELDEMTINPTSLFADMDSVARTAVLRSY